MLTTAADIAQIVAAIASAVSLLLALRRRQLKQIQRMPRPMGGYGIRARSSQSAPNKRVVTNLKVRLDRNGIRIWRLRPPKYRSARIDIPTWALVFLASDDAERYRREFGAYVWQLVDEGHIKQARRARRRLILTAISFAVVLRTRRLLGRARSR